MTTTVNKGFVPGSVLFAVAILAAAPVALAQEPLRADDTAAGDLFACALDLDGTTLLVGSLLHDDQGTDSGSAYVFELDPGDVRWRQSAELYASDAAAGHQFGFAVALDGDRALVGAPLAGAGGAIYQFQHQPGGDQWSEVGRVEVAEGGASGGGAVAFAATRALAGAPTADTGGRVDAGIVLAFPFPLDGGAVERIAAQEPQAGAGLGWALAADGGRAAIGAPWTDGPFTDSGAVHLFAETGAGFTETVRITPADGRPFDAFGYSVALSGDLLAVGAPRAGGPAGPGAGKVYLFRLGDGGVTLEDRFFGPAGAQLGTSVALEGNLLAAGARLEGAAVGAVHFFRRQGGSWVEDEDMRFQPAAARAGDEVGIDVDLSAAGGFVVGAYRDDGGGAEAGAAYTRVPPPVVPVPPPMVDLVLTKTVVTPAGDVAAPPGSEVVFKVVVENRGPTNVVGAPVRDKRPRDLTGVKWRCTPHLGGSCTGDGTGSIDERVDLPAGASVIYRITGIIAQSAAGPLVNRASVEPPPGLVLSNPAAAAAEATVPLGPASADLYLDVRSLALEEGGAGVVVPGEPIVHELEIGNLGPSDAPPLAFAGGGFAPSFVAPTWTCAGSDGATCVPAAGAGPIAGTLTLPAGGAVVYVITATVLPAATGSIVLAGDLGALTGLDPKPANNADTVTTPLGSPSADLYFDLRSLALEEGGAGVAVPGEPIVHDLEIGNLGPSDAPPLSSFTFGSFDESLVRITWICTASDGATCAPGAGEGPVAGTLTLPAGGAVVYRITATVLPAATGSIVLAGGFGDFPGLDPEPANNADTVTTPVGPPMADIYFDLRSLALEEGGAGFVVPGEPIVHDLEIGNLGPSDAPPFAFTGDLFDESFVAPTWTCTGSGGATCAPGAGAGTVAGTLTLPAGGAVIYRITATVSLDTTGWIILEGGFTDLAPLDPNPANNADTVATPVGAALEIPALSAWGFGALSLLLAAAALGLLRRTA